jgi:hypothetical protein
VSQERHPVVGRYAEIVAVKDLLDVALDPAADVRMCPVCRGHPLMAVDSGRTPPFLWRCEETDQYWRRKDDAAPRDGRIVCRTYGGPLFGFLRCGIALSRSGWPFGEWRRQRGPRRGVRRRRRVPAHGLSGLRRISESVNAAGPRGLSDLLCEVGVTDRAFGPGKGTPVLPEDEVHRERFVRHALDAESAPGGDGPVGRLVAG